MQIGLLLVTMRSPCSHCPTVGLRLYGLELFSSSSSSSSSSMLCNLQQASAHHVDNSSSDLVRLEELC